MNADRRIVPEKHISYLLEEEHIPERTKAIKHKLIRSPKKIDKVADHWVESTGINSLARVMLKNVSQVPRAHTTVLKETTKHSHKATTVATPPAAHAVHQISWDMNHHAAHDDHHGAVAHHTPDHSHHEPHASHHAEHSHWDHHDTHWHGHHDDHWHGGHWHGSHGNSHWHGHHGGHFSSFTSSWHWCGRQWARIFAMIGRIIWEIVGYIIKTFIVAILFWPTRTALLVLFISIFLNTTMDTSLPIWIAASIAGIIHLIFTGIGMISSSWGHWEWGHGGGHWGGHGHH